MTNRTKITMAGAGPFAPADGREDVLWDSAAPGIGLRAQPNGWKRWIVHGRCNRSVVKRTLGALTVEADARHAARALLAETQAKRAPDVVPTVRTFAPAFLADCTDDRRRSPDRCARARGPDSRARIRHSRYALQGFMLRVQPNGTRSWVFRIRRNGKPCRVTHGNPSTLKATMSYPNSAILPALGHLRVGLVECADIARFFQEYGRRKLGGAN